MTTLYELAMLGSPSDAQLDELHAVVAQSIEPFGLSLGREVAWSVRPDKFVPDQLNASAAVFFGGVNAPVANIDELMHRAIPVIPIVSNFKMVSLEILDFTRFRRHSSASSLQLFERHRAQLI